MKVTKELDLDIYTRKVTVEMTEAEWEYITGLAADWAASIGATTVAAARLANGSKPYWDKNLDYSRLFVSEADTKYPFGELNYAEKQQVAISRSLDAIKAYRIRNGCSLKEAKDAVDRYRGIKLD